MSEYPENKLSALLARLNLRSDESVRQLQVTGRALSRSETSLHLHTAAGMAAIPISEISNVRVSDADPLFVAVDVKNARAVQLIGSGLGEVAPTALQNSGGTLGQECFYRCYDVARIHHGPAKAHAICEEMCEISMPPQISFLYHQLTTRLK